MLRIAMGNLRGIDDRPDLDEIHDLARRSTENPMVRAVLDSIEGLVMILDKDRRVLAANPELLESMDLLQAERLVGQRPGDAMGCIHTDEGPDGCGSGPACIHCGALVSILASQEQKVSVPAECCLSIRKGGRLEAREFRVRSTPLVMGAHRLTVLVLQDISAEKRRQVLEAMFFHDVRNAVQGITAWSEALGVAELDPQGVARKILELSTQLNEQVTWKHRLFQAEAGTLGLELREVSIQELLASLEALFATSELRRGRKVGFPGRPPQGSLRTDPDLVLQVLGGMLTNALEATPEGGEVSVACAEEEAGYRFAIHNPGCIPEPVALRIFQRSFTTKTGPGRGLGTYSMRILGENLLGGTVDFRSTPDEGTRFFLRLPRTVDP